MENAASENQVQNGGGVNEANGLPAKSLRIRLRLRLQKPHDESPGHRKLLQQWALKKTRTPYDPEAKSKKKGGEETEVQNDSEDDVAIARWKNLKSGSIRKWVSSKSQETENEERDKILLSSDGETEEQEEEEQEEGGKDDGEEAGKEMEEEIETNLVANGVDLNLVPENSDPCNPDVPFDNENGDRGVNQNENGDEGVNQNEKKRKGDRVQVKLLLNELGLRRYKSLFKAHKVDDQSLPFLTYGDLKKMGIIAVGHRRKIYCSIQKLGSS